MMIKCVDEEFPNPMPRVTMQMVSHNKEEEEGEGEAGMPNWLKRCQQQISAHKIYKRPIARCTKCINTRQLTLASFQESLVIDAWPNRYLSPLNMFAPFGIDAGSQVYRKWIETELKSFFLQLLRVR